jgi:hypothetical protein
MVNFMHERSAALVEARDRVTRSLIADTLYPMADYGTKEVHRKLRDAVVWVMQFCHENNPK